MVYFGKLKLEPLNIFLLFCTYLVSIISVNLWMVHYFKNNIVMSQNEWIKNKQLYLKMFLYQVCVETYIEHVKNISSTLHNIITQQGE